MNYERMPIEIESPEQIGYDKIKYNLTESSYSDLKVSDLNLKINFQDVLLCYGDHLGKLELRQLLAKQIGVDANDILITPGAAAALFIIHTTLLKPNDRLVVEFPNYGTNLETPKAIGANVDKLNITFENGFRPTLEQFESALKTKAKLVSMTVPHNPTGTVVSEKELRAIVELTKKAGSYLLVDETYADMNFDSPLPVAATLGSHVMSISSLSKTYGLPGIRIGWIVCKDKKLMEKFLAAKEQIMICGSVLDEEVAYHFLKQRDHHLQNIKKSILEKRGILMDWYKNQSYMEMVTPKAGVVAFPRIKSTDPQVIENFYKILNNDFGTWVGPGHWFGFDKRYMRVGYGWPTPLELSAGLNCLTQTLKRLIK